MVVKFGVVYEPPVPKDVVKFEFVYHVIVPEPEALTVAFDPQVIVAPLDVGAVSGLTVTVTGKGWEKQACPGHGLLKLEIVAVKVPQHPS